MKTKLSNDMNVILGALVRRIKQRAYLDSDEEIARWIEEYCEQSNSHKHGVMQAEGSDGVSGAAVGNSAAGKGVCGGLTKCIKFDNGQGYCDLCGEKI